MRTLSPHDLPSSGKSFTFNSEKLKSGKNLWALIGSAAVVAGGLSLYTAHAVSKETNNSIQNTTDCSVDALANSENPLLGLSNTTVVLEVIDDCAQQQNFVLHSSVRAGLVDDVQDALSDRLFNSES